MPVDPEEIVITVGATEAINLRLQAVAKPGDTVAVESPTYYAMLHATERLGMRAIEVPTHPAEGIDVDALARIVARRKIAACMVMPNFQNPLGFQMPERKRALVDLLSAHEIPVIENDVYQELYYGDARPSPLKSFDTKGLVLHCASFSKSLSASYRIGWAMPGRFRAQVEKLKFLNTLTTPSVPQVAIADYLRQDGYDRHLRCVRRLYRQQARIMSAMVERFFPPGTRTSTPQGGYVLWVELPESVDSMKLYRAALEAGITVGSGYMFSTRHAFGHFIWLNSVIRRRTRRGARGAQRQFHIERRTLNERRNRSGAGRRADATVARAAGDARARVVARAAVEAVQSADEHAAPPVDRAGRGGASEVKLGEEGTGSARLSDGGETLCAALFGPGA